MAKVLPGERTITFVTPVKGLRQTWSVGSLGLAKVSPGERTIIFVAPVKVSNRSGQSAKSHLEKEQ